MSPKLLILLAVTGFASLVSSAQKNLNTPFSRFGLGIQSNNFIGQSFSMGGLTTAMNDPYTLNIGNPAAYASLKYTSAEFSFKGGANTLTDNSGSATSFNAHLGGFAMGFKMGDHFGGGFGLRPKTQIGYSIVLPDQTNPNDSLYYEGFGGTNEVFAGLAYRNGGDKIGYLSIGANFAYQFGQIKQDRTFAYDSSAFYDFRVQDELSLGSFLYDVGVQYQSPEIYKDWSVNLGLTYKPEQNVDVIRSRYAYLTSYSSLGFTPGTTVYNSTDNPDLGTMNMPALMSYGIGFRKGENLYFGFQYDSEGWNTFSVMGEHQNLFASTQLRFGAEYSPVDREDRLLPNNSVFEKMTYRVGARYYNSYMNVNSMQVSEFGINFGLSVPVFSQIIKGENEKPISSVSFGFEIGQRGSLDVNGLSENFYRFNLTYTFNDRWFKPEKID